MEECFCNGYLHCHFIPKWILFWKATYQVFSQGPSLADRFIMAHDDKQMQPVFALEGVTIS